RGRIVSSLDADHGDRLHGAPSSTLAQYRTNARALHYAKTAIGGEATKRNGYSLRAKANTRETMQETLLDDVRSRGFSQTPARRRRNAAGYGLFALLIAAAPSIATDLTWFDRDRLSPQARELMTILQDAESYGLQREDYELGLVEHERQLVLANRGIDADVRWRVDAALTAAAARFLDDVHDGRISPREVGFDLPSPERKFDAAQAARELARARDVGAAIAALEPRPAPYALLKQALRRYRELAKQGDLHDLPALRKRPAKPGEDYAGAPQLRKLLIALGDLDIESAR